VLKDKGKPWNICLKVQVCNGAQYPVSPDHVARRTNLNVIWALVKLCGGTLDELRCGAADPGAESVVHRSIMWI
jgi:hypothetical protein